MRFCYCTPGRLQLVVAWCSQTPLSPALPSLSQQNGRVHHADVTVVSRFVACTFAPPGLHNHSPPPESQSSVPRVPTHFNSDHPRPPPVSVISSSFTPDHLLPHFATHFFWLKAFSQPLTLRLPSQHFLFHNAVPICNAAPTSSRKRSHIALCPYQFHSLLLLARLAILREVIAVNRRVTQTCRPTLPILSTPLCFQSRLS